MWVMLYDCFFSIVQKDCAPDELMVRARRPGDIEKVWPSAKVTEYTASDYHYRAAIKKADVIAAITHEIDDIEYSNFKDQVGDKQLHDAYLSVWTTMAKLQPNAPYSGRRRNRQHHTPLPDIQYALRGIPSHAKPKKKGKKK